MRDMFFSVEWVDRLSFLKSFKSFSSSKVFLFLLFGANKELCWESKDFALILLLLVLRRAAMMRGSWWN